MESGSIMHCMTLRHYDQMHGSIKFSWGVFRRAQDVNTNIDGEKFGYLNRRDPFYCTTVPIYLTRVVSGIMEQLREKLKSSPQFKTNLATLGISN